MKQLLLSILLFFCVSCNFAPRCIDAVDFGDAKIGFDTKGKDVTLKYPNGKSEYSWFMGSDPVSSGYVLTGEEIVAKIDGAWSPWSKADIEGSTSYKDLKGNNRVCHYKDDFKQCNEGAVTNSNATSCLQPKWDENANPKVCWYIEGVGIFIAFSANPEEGAAQYYHVADYFTNSHAGYPDDWYFVMDPTELDINGQSLPASLGVDEYSEVKVWTYIHIYDYNTNIDGCIREKKNPQAEKIPDKLKLVDGDIEACAATVTMILYEGVRLDDPVYTQAAADSIFDNAIDIIESLFNSFVSSSYLGSLINVSLAIMISYFGIAFFLGLTRFTNQEMLLNVMRVGIVFTIINSSTGWEYYNNYFVKFIWDGSQELASEVMRSVNTAVVNTVQDLEDYYFISSVQTSVFGVIDDILTMFLASETHTKIWSILFSHEFGLFIVILIYIALINFLLALVKFTMALILVFFTMMVLLGIGPIMFVFLLFGFTREYFTKWIQNLLSVFLQPVLYLIFFGPFATLATFYLYKILYFEVCWNTLCCEPLFPLFGTWFVETSYSYDYNSDSFSRIGYYDPNYYDILILFMISALLNLGIEKITEIATKLSGGFSFATNPIAKQMMGGIQKVGVTGRNVLGKGAFMAGKGVARKVAIDSANVAGAMGMTSVAKMVSGSKASNFAKAKANVKNTLRDRGYTDAEISERMKSDKKIQGDVQEDFLRLQGKTRAKYTVKGALGSLKAEIGDKDGKLDLKSALRIPMALFNRGTAGYNLSNSKDFRNKKMSKSQRQELSDRLTGVGKFNKVYSKNKVNQKEAKDYFDKNAAQDKKREDNKEKDAKFFKEGKLGELMKSKLGQRLSAAGDVASSTKDVVTLKATRESISRSATEYKEGLDDFAKGVKQTASDIRTMKAPRNFANRKKNAAARVGRNIKKSFGFGKKEDDETEDS
ncbi:MAG: hypothetical protein HOM96_03690 [Rickettsiales bacterium]|nr:hypothetical protein [Rickettsiales bacterium]